jgi:hypothetical protein
MSYDLLGDLRERIDVAVDSGLTKRAIVRALEEAIEEVEADDEIPA